MKLLRDAFERDDRLYAVSSRDSSYSILLTRNASSEAPWRVTSFRGKEPIGHREYDRLDGGAPTQNALGEFAGDDWRIVRKPMPKRERARKVREAEEGFAACAGAISGAPNDTDLAMFERGQRIWKRRLDALKR
jgi:hypothetical protein